MLKQKEEPIEVFLSEESRVLSALLRMIQKDV